MSNNISFEEAVSTLKVMFPDWEEEVLTTVLISNNYHVERTIENILTMSGDTTITTEPQPANNNPNPADRMSTNPSPSRSLSNESRDGGVVKLPPGSRYRGRMCHLPDDFLRPPGYHPRIIADEELALMLQNEMFRKEAQLILGEDFNRAVRGNQQQPNQQGGRGTTQQRPSVVRRDSNPNANTATADLGIVKAISSMGSAAKKNLSQLAERFSQSSKASRNRGTDREFKPLAGEEEDEFEIISFDSKANRNKHRLNPDDGEEFGYKNPLFKNASNDMNDVNK